MKIRGIRCSVILTALFVPNYVFAQAIPPLSVCVEETKLPACDAVRGDRANGWLAQSRAEVMAPHDMVATSQPLAAQAGLQMMLRGGNAVDAAVVALGHTSEIRRGPMTDVDGARGLSNVANCRHVRAVGAVADSPRSTVTLG